MAIDNYIIFQIPKEMKYQDFDCSDLNIERLSYLSNHDMLYIVFKRLFYCIYSMYTNYLILKSNPVIEIHIV